MFSCLKVDISARKIHGNSKNLPSHLPEGQCEAPELDEQEQAIGATFAIARA